MVNSSEGQITPTSTVLLCLCSVSAFAAGGKPIVDPEAASEGAKELLENIEGTGSTGIGPDEALEKVMKEIDGQDNPGGEKTD